MESPIAERSRAAEPSADQPKRDSGPLGRGGGWVQFNGSASSRGDDVILVPLDDARVSVTMLAEDVQYMGKAVFVRVGASGKSVDIPADSDNYPVRPAEGSECRGAGTRCVGGVEFCCDTGKKVRGNCPRNWRCPEG